MSRPTTTLARTLRGYFTDYLPTVLGVSPHTTRSYRDTLALLLRFLVKRKRRGVDRLDLGDLEPEAVLAFLTHLERERGNRVATRNARLAAIHSFARYVGVHDPEHLELCQRLLAVPFKRAPVPAVEHLEADEVQAMLGAADRATSSGRRDYALMLTLFNTGARVQELLDLRARDIQLIRPLQARLLGKGRKERICPLWPETADVLRALLDETDLAASSSQRVFRNRRGEPLTRFGVRYILNRLAQQASDNQPSLRAKCVHPHTIRHTTAVHLLQSGVDLATISHWLGHASVETTNRYATVDLEAKRSAIAKARLTTTKRRPQAAWRSNASILEWLEAL